MFHSTHQTLCLFEQMRSGRHDIGGRNIRLTLRSTVIATHLRRGRQLQHDCPLPWAQIGEQDDCTIWKLDSVMMPLRVLRVYLPEASELSAKPLFLEEPEERPT